jgi:glucose-1-phosphate adenylyltransferase
VQFKPQELIEHIRKGWAISRLMPEESITVVPPQMHAGAESFRGTADAVFQSLHLIETFRLDVVAVFGADHVYRMDVRQMAWFHRERQAYVTVAALPVPIEQASSFGVIETEADGRIRGFHEKPATPKSMPSDPKRAYASMGNYLFETELLIEAHARPETDFGHHVLPRLVANHRLLAYDFTTNVVPGIKPYEEAGYWRDVGTIDAYFESHSDVLGAEPRFDVFCPQRPIYSSNYQGRWRKSSAAISRTAASAQRAWFMLEPPSATVSYAARQYHVTPGGVVVVARGRVSYFARDSRGQGPGYIE